MMREAGISMNVKVSRVRLLEQLRVNLRRHRTIYQEAVVGFNEQARKKLEQVLRRVTGTEDIYLNLTAPKDYSEAYKTAIEMLEWSNDDEITLSASEFRKLAQDKWDWMDTWLASNSAVSETAALYQTQLGGGTPEDIEATD